MIYEILNDGGEVINRIVADAEFVETVFPGHHQLASETVTSTLTEAEYITAMEAMYDATAQERRYDNRNTCALRAGYAGPFQAEGTAFAQWMDACNAKGYELMGKVLAGTMPQPTVPELLDMLPTLTWPTPVAP